MEKVKVVLVVLNKKFLGNALNVLNYNRAVPFVVLTEDGDEKFLVINEKLKVQRLPFSFLNQVVELGKDFLWLICGRNNDSCAADGMKTFLAKSGVPEKNIINFALTEKIAPAWLGNLRMVEEGGADSFATGDELTVHGLDFKNISGIKGANLAADGQDLRQSLKIAQHIFAKVKRGSIKFVFIGLAPYCLCADTRKNFSTCTDDLRYALALKETFQVENAHDKLLANLLSSNVNKFFASVTSEQADLNFDKIRATREKKISVEDVTNWQEETARLTKKFDATLVEDNLRVLESYIKLCLDNGAKPIGLLFPFTAALRENYSREVLMLLRSELRWLEKVYNLTFIDMFSAQADYDCFSDMTHLNLKGAALASTAIDLRLRGKDFLPIEKVSRLNYEDIFNVSNFLTKDDFNETIEKYFKLAEKKIRGRRKIHVGFVSDDPSMWCGDKLFNLFADNRRCLTTFFLCLQKSYRDQPSMIEDFQRGLDEFKARGINVVGVTDDEQTVPAQDVLIMLRPYFHYLPKAFELKSISAQTLMAYIPYGFNMTNWNICDTPIHRFGWKLFFESREHIKNVEKLCREGAPRCLYSGYTKTDVFCENTDGLKFDWKMTRPDAKKIIYAPHWSIASGIFYATFQWNYKFMYEFAKAHPEISWVLKPHPMLLASAVGHGVFPDDKSFKQYLEAWDNLPNAKVFTGPYYQGLFATSDGMIMDCGSWLGEYQYTHKPMIFLTRDTQEFNHLGNELMKVLYRVDGKNLKGIAAAMQKVFIEGKDEMFAARKKFFDEHMNYIKANGTTAAEFIFKTIAHELRF